MQSSFWRQVLVAAVAIVVADVAIRVAFRVAGASLERRNP